MLKLDLHVPPVILLPISGGLMWIVALFSPGFSINIHFYYTVTPILLVVLGSCIAISGIFELYRAGTTVNPLRPELTSSLVMTGVYRYSRNPIYLGLVVILLSWGFYLSNSLSLLFVIAFIHYVSHFQIKPEERILHKSFGSQFEQYQCNVRRWI